MNRRQVGAGGEQTALLAYQKMGYELVNRNYYTRYGEMDLILKNPEYLVFCEVKLRGSQRFGTGAEAVTAAKRKRLVQTARYYLAQNETSLQPRFDVALVTRLPGGGGFGIEIIENAFEAEE